MSITWFFRVGNKVRCG